MHSSVQCKEGNEIITDDGKSDVNDVIDNSSEMFNVLSSVQNLCNSISDNEGLTVVNKDYISKMQMNDVTFKEMFGKINEHGEFQGCTIHANGLLVHKVVDSSTHDMAHDTTGQVACIAIPQAFRSKVLELAHSVTVSGHFGVGKTHKRVLPFFYGPGMLKDIKQFYKTCDMCQCIVKPNNQNVYQ